MQKANTYNAHHSGYITVSLRCPSCHQIGTLERLAEIYDADICDSQTGYCSIAGMRRCPNEGCHTLIFFVCEDGYLTVTYPAEHLDFDSSGIPAPVANAFEEAITCHANRSFVAAAIMVRKTLEELCHERGATGSSLKARLGVLRDKVVLPQELLDGMDDLRLLGNDAAHIESQAFNQIGQEEIEVAIDFTKEVLKGVYQYSALLDRFRALKRVYS